MRLLVVTSCTGRKATTHPDQLTIDDFRNPVSLKAREQAVESLMRPAGEMYTGKQHEHLMRGVRLLRRAFGREAVDVKIVSAGYGLVGEHEMIAPYNVTFSTMSGPTARSWARERAIAEDVRSAVKGYPLVVFLLGSHYLGAIKPPIFPHARQRLAFFAKQSAESELRGAGVVIIPAGTKETGIYHAGNVALKGKMFELFAGALIRGGQSLWEAVLKDQTPTTIAAALKGA